MNQIYMTQKPWNSSFLMAIFCTFTCPNLFHNLPPNDPWSRLPKVNLGNNGSLQDFWSERKAIHMRNLRPKLSTTEFPNPTRAAIRGKKMKKASPVNQESSRNATWFCSNLLGKMESFHGYQEFIGVFLCGRNARGNMPWWPQNIWPSRKRKASWE